MILVVIVITGGAVSAYADTKSGADAWSRGEYDVAVKEWRVAALAGDADAQFNLGQAYKLGRGVTTDLDVALEWYRKAAAQGHLQAADSCGHVLHFQQKIPEAIPFLTASSDRGEPRAQYLLATELFNGVHIPKDWVRAYALMTRSAAGGMAPASRSLTQMDQYIPIEQRQAGTLVAAELEQRANRLRPSQRAVRPINNGPTTQKIAPVDIQPSATTALPAPAPTIASKAKKSAEGSWRIQLGAFSKAGNAQKLWEQVSNNITEFAEMKPIVRKDGSFTLLQAGPFTSITVALSIEGTLAVRWPDALVAIATMQ